MRFGSLGLFEILVIAGLIVLLFSGRALPRLGRVIGEQARKPFRQAKWLWNSAAGSEEDEICAEEEFGRECAREFLAGFPDPVAAGKQELVAEVGARMANGKKRTFCFRAVHSSTVNAFALPGGFIFVTDSLLDLCAGDRDEVAFLLGHEMAHVALKHATDKYMAGELVQAIAKRAGAASRLVSELAGRGYSQLQEWEADDAGQRLAEAAGFDASGGTSVLSRLARLSPRQPELVEYFSSHPPSLERARRLEEAGRGRAV